MNPTETERAPAAGKQGTPEPIATQGPRSLGAASTDRCFICGTALHGAPSAHEGRRSGVAYCEECFRAESEERRDGIFAEAARARWPTFRAGTDAELAAVAALRRLPLAGIRLARARGLLRFATCYGAPCYVVTDDARQLAQARRMDGTTWKAGVKALTLTGSIGGWPLGVEYADGAALLLLCEGGPDLLAGCAVVASMPNPCRVAALGMMGASMHIRPEAVALLRGIRCRIACHADAAGLAAGERWANQLRTIAQAPDLWQPDPPAKDLCDAIAAGVPSASIVEGAL